MPLTTAQIPVSVSVNGYQDGKLAGICQAWGSMAKLAADFGARIRELRDLLEESQATFAERWGRTAKQMGVWENGKQRPHYSAVQRAAEKNGWPMAIFEKGGPMPSVALKRPANGRTVREAPSGAFYPNYGVRGPGTAARFYRAIIRQLSADFGQGETVTVEEAASYVQALWNYATEECPALERDIEPGAG